MDPYSDDPIPTVQVGVDGDYVEYLDYERVERVVAAARAWGVCKERATAEWIEHGKVSPSTTNSLDKATDNLLVALAADV
jgi:hypothetical protein